MLSPLPRVKDFKSRKEWEAAVWRDLVRQCSSLRPSELKNVLELITSPYERRIISLRATAITRIRGGASYRDVGQELWLTPQTISAIKKGLVMRGYTSNWERAKALKRERGLKRLMQRGGERPLPKRYRRTKYGKMRIS